MPLHVRTQGLETVIHRHIEAVETEEVLCRGGRQDTIEMVLATIDRVARDGEDIAQRLLGYMPRFTAPETKTNGLRPAHDHQHEVDQPRVR